MATRDFIAAIELGSTKIAGMAGRRNSDGSIQVLAYAREEAAQFIRKGVIYNIDKTAAALTNIINRLEGELHASIEKVYVGLGGQSLRTLENRVTHTLDEESVISQELVDTICDENTAIPLADMNIIDVAPQEYKIDSNLQADPVGVTGRSIIGRFLNIVARATLKKNLEQSFQQAHVNIADVLIAPVALAKATLTADEMRAGCVLVDFGADTTTVIIYKDSILRYLGVLPLGGNSITNDITSLQMEERDAERLKLTYGDALYEEPAGNETPATCTLDDGRTLELGELNNLIGARTEEILANVRNLIQLSGYEDKLFSGIVLTGGGTNLKNLPEAFRKYCKVEQTRKLRVARSINEKVTGLTEEQQQPAATLCTLLGLLAAGRDNCCLQEAVKPQPAPPAPDKPIDMFKDDADLKEQEEVARKAKLQQEKEEKIRREQERKRVAEEKERIRREEEKRKKKEGPGWLKRTFNRLSTDLFEGDADMK